MNRSLPRAKRLADNVRELGVAAEAFPFDHLPPVLTDADILVCCTGAVRPVVSLADVHRGLAHGQEPKQLVICDLGMPRDVDPAVAGLPGVSVVDMDRIQREPSARAAAADAEAARAIVAAEVANYLAGQRMAEVTPTVTALRQRAADVVEAELLRLDNRLPGLEAAYRDEVAKTVRRVVDKLLHAPTVRVKQLASAPGGDSYAEALRELFELDQQAVDAVAAGELPLMAHRSRQDRVELGPATVIRIGTRGSLLATTQAGVIKDALEARGHAAELVIISTDGDRSDEPIADIGVGVFTAALREAIDDGEVDMAVHSYKDLPTAPDPRFKIAAIPPREDARDALVARDGLVLGELPAGSVIGTSSPRRAAQLRALGLGLEIRPLRGNLDTRLNRVSNGDLDGIVVARAGLARIGRIGDITETLEPVQMLPAPAQGALAVECRAGDTELAALLSELDDADTRAAVTAERALLAALEAGCSAPVGAIAEVVESIDEDGRVFEEVSLRGCVATLDGSDVIRASGVGTTDRARELGLSVADGVVRTRGARAHGGYADEHRGE